MPCRDYADDYKIIDNTQTYKEMRDKLARIACNACRNLEKLEEELATLKKLQAKYGRI